MSDRDTKVLGFIAMSPNKSGVLCDGNSCVVAGSVELMRQYIVNSGALVSSYDIIKARYGHVLQGMLLGGAYSFDQESFERFRPLATIDGYDVAHISTHISAWPKGGTGIPLTRIQIVR